MPTMNDMRRYISNRYESMNWKNKVSKMPTRQVIAIYRRFKEADEKAKLEATCPNSEYHQIDMFEYLYSVNQGKETNTEVKI